jgi:hypothetical protein
MVHMTKNDLKETKQAINEIKFLSSSGCINLEIAKRKLELIHKQILIIETIINNLNW